MVGELKRMIKSSKFLYVLYFAIFSTFLKLLGLFVKTDERLILFVVYGGQRYDDSPRFVYEYMKTHKRYNKFIYVWAFIKPDEIEGDIRYKIKIDTLKYFITALKAKYWVTNSSVSRGLDFKKRDTVNVMFPHGITGIKYVGNDLEGDNKSFVSKSKKKEADIIALGGKNELNIIRRVWNINGAKIIKKGLPRNDELVNWKIADVEALKKKLNIAQGKKVILYAPTFREYNKDSQLFNYLKPPFNFDYWYKELGDKYVLLFTAHYEVAKLLNFPENHPFVVNAFKYPRINDLMLISDILISDYSSIIFDYSILERPILSYAYDYELYKRERGIYDGYENMFMRGIFKKEKEIVAYIKMINYEEECIHTKKYIKDKYVIANGRSTEECVRHIFESV